MMTRYTAAAGTLPLWRRADAMDVAYVAYGLAVLVAVMLSYLAGAFELLAYDAQAMDLEQLMAPPGTSGHLLGTDFLGRDILSRLVIGIQAYFLPGLLAVAVALTLGTTLGVLAGLYGGRTQTAVSYVTNLTDALPRLVLILLVVAALRPDIYYIMLVVGLTHAPVVAGLVQHKIQMLKHKNFVASGIALGLPTRIIVLKHILWYNCRALLVIQASVGMGEAILIETSLSYLGFGVQEPTPSWGNMVQTGANYLLQGEFWPSTAPALAITLTVMGFYLLGDGLNNILEGRLRS